jgi:hydrogenase-4 component B
MTACLTLVLAGAAIWALSGLVHLALPHRTGLAERIAAALSVCGSMFGCAGALLAAFGHPGAATANWSVPGLSFAVACDGLSALFLLPVFVTSAFAAVYGIGYGTSLGARASMVRVFQGTLVAGMVLLVLARNGALFLVGWEVMAVSGFLLIGAEHHKPETRSAAWVYLVTTHLCTLCLVATMALLQTSEGSLDWSPAAIAALSPARTLAVFTLALVGFGIKAGLMPMHVWLPGAHGNAPSHVSAVLSGVLIKMGAYGFLRIVTMLPALPAACGVTVLLLGATSALLGIVATFAQSDLKRLLAYSSIENSGIIFLGLGIALLGHSLGDQRLYVLGLGGALFHVLNHSLYKPLLFLCAGSVIHASGTRELDELGGLWRRMPRTGACFLVGSIAICGLPLLNGFASEFVLYVGLFHTVAHKETLFALLGTAVLAALAMTGGLTVSTFVRTTAAVFLGRARSPASAQAHESPKSMTIPLFGIAALCLGIGLVPVIVVPLLDSAIAALPSSAEPANLASLIPFGVLSTVGIGCALAICIAFFGIAAVRRRHRSRPTVGTWDCGYVDASSPRLQYTGSSFAQIGVRLLDWAARERTQITESPGLFPGPRTFTRKTNEPLLRGTVWPLLKNLADRCQSLRFLQRGNLHIYLLYVLITLVVLLAWSTSAS